jgi:S-DNA-T family DNA segregation ATPase FtsK/SpoIIIE
MNRKAKYFLFLSSLALATFLGFALASVHPSDWPFGPRAFDQVRNLSGPLGSALAYLCVGALGRFFAWVVPVLFLIVGVGVSTERVRHAWKLVGKVVLVVLLMNAFFALLPLTRESTLLKGSLGKQIAVPFSAMLGEIGATILVITALLFVLLTQIRRFGDGTLAVVAGVGRGMRGAGPAAASAVRAATSGVRGLTHWLGEQWAARRKAATEAREERAEEATHTAEDVEPVVEGWLDADFPGASARVEEAWSATSAPHLQAPLKARPKPRPRPRPSSDEPAGVPLSEAVLPPLSILQSVTRAGGSIPQDKLRSWSAILEDKLSNYGVHGKVTAVNQGPLVTTFEFEPAPGVKIKDIVSRSDDLALAMRAHSLRLIAPIPGRAVVGIEIANPERDMVYLHDVLKEIPERLRYSGIMLALGVDATGKPFNMNLCAAPHLLMAGTTGSGKSVSLNAMLASILFQYRPSDVRLILIDPKMVELTAYNGIPHLLHPVITDPREAVRVFNYLIGEMEARNRLFRKSGVKNLESFNSKVALGKADPNGPTEKLPYIVLVVDELGDLVLTKGADMESLLSRLSNMARAVGIHMIVATQRPSVDVIVGKTKANFPTRIAFRVATKVDSRTILDCMGAEKLIGRGDMLYVDAKHPEAIRIHGPWISEEELEQLTNHWRQYDFEESQLELFETNAGGVSGEDKDPLFDDARDIVLHYRQGSTSLLQRKLHVGYARAARILDQLEEAGIVGPPDGSKPREVLASGENPSDHGADASSQERSRSRL